MSQFDGKVVLISGAGRGQGRSHAIRFAKEGAAIIAFDRCADLNDVPYSLATQGDLEETERMVKEVGGRVLTGVADVRNTNEIKELIDAGITAFGRIDVVLANAGIVGNVGPIWELDDSSFQAVIDINLIGAWRTVKLAVPELLKSKGSVILTSSGLGVKGAANVGSYVASKHGVIGLMRSLAKELAPHGVRVNAILPGNCDTDMMQSLALRRLYVPENDSPTREELAERTIPDSPMGIPWVDAADISEAALWLSSDAARFVTGVLLPVDGGTAIP
jgi:SDR family mycofactocin-dependent oxidoreductase